MTKEVLVCDRCGKESTDKNKSKYLRVTKGIDLYDLCDLCSLRFIKWMENLTYLKAENKWLLPDDIFHMDNMIKAMASEIRNLRDSYNNSQVCEGDSPTYFSKNEEDIVCEYRDKVLE